MTDREVMKRALEIIETHHGEFDYAKEIAILRAALEQQAEPVHGDIRVLKYRIHELEGEVIGYKRMLDVAEAPPQRKPLTTEERGSIVNDVLRGHASTRDAIDWAIRHVERLTHGADPAALAIRNLLKSGVGIIPAGKEEI